ncbi:hypothetical protein GCM10027075_02220 [Streptomyces heilongjiangensis]
MSLSWRCQKRLGGRDWHLGMSWGTFPELRCRGTYPGSFERPSRTYASRQTAPHRTTTSYTQDGTVLLSDSGAGPPDARPDPVGGIRTGTWEGALLAGPWGDQRRRAPSFCARKALSRPSRGSAARIGHAGASHRSHRFPPARRSVPARARKAEWGAGNRVNGSPTPHDGERPPEKP